MTRIGHSMIHAPWLRTVPARWFELLTAREDLTMAVETLADTDAVELETHSESTTRLTMPDLHGRLEEYNRLAQRYQPYWPQDNLTPSETPGQPSRTLDTALAHLHAWRKAADPTVEALEELHQERDLLLRIEDLLRGLGQRRLPLDRFPDAGPALAAQVFVLPHRTEVHAIPAGVISQNIGGHDHEYLVAVGPPNEVDGLEQELAQLKGRRLRLPSWLHSNPTQSLQRLEARRRAMRGEEEALYLRLQELQTTHQLSEALGDVSRLEWFLTHVESLPVTENFAWVTGWTSDQDGATLNSALDKAGIRALLRFPEPPRGKVAPMVMDNPWWARPFELFARLLGVPGSGEVDPSRLLVVIAPLLFGYMFGDLGQGLLLFLAGLALRKRWPALNLLLAAGASAMVFGILFGSVFSREDLIPAIWLHPIHDPITVLVVPLYGGALLLLLGLALNSLQAFWRGQWRLWWQKDAALMLLYLGVLGATLHPRLLLVVAIALVWYLSASLWTAAAGRRLRALGLDLGALLEQSFQLAVNTLSFARVGAFALAHTGLSLAIVSLADAAIHPVLGIIIMVAGNALIIALEGLVVSIQLTRLMLFEFFIRFLHGEGRTFRPLPAPAGSRRQPTSTSSTEKERGDSP